MGNGRSGLRPEVLADLSDTTSFTPGELNDLYRQYRHDCIQQGKDKFSITDNEILWSGGKAPLLQHSHWSVVTLNTSWWGL